MCFERNTLYAYLLESKRITKTDNEDCAVFKANFWGGLRTVRRVSPKTLKKRRTAVEQALEKLPPHEACVREEQPSVA